MTYIFTLFTYLHTTPRVCMHTHTHTHTHTHLFSPFPSQSTPPETAILLSSIAKSLASISFIEFHYILIFLQKPLKSSQQQVFIHFNKL